jgi:hypothetical protein
MGTNVRFVLIAGVVSLVTVVAVSAAVGALPVVQRGSDGSSSGGGATAPAAQDQTSPPEAPSTEEFRHYTPAPGDRPEFSIEELYEWRLTLAREGWPEWMTALWISGNRVWLGILDWEYRDATEAFLDEIGIPREAVIIARQPIVCTYDCPTDDLQ